MAAIAPRPSLLLAGLQGGAGGLERAGESQIPAQRGAVAESNSGTTQRVQLKAGKRRELGAYCILIKA